MNDEPASEQGRGGLYSNYFEVGHNAYQFVIQCGEAYDEAESPTLHTRIITGPPYAKALLATLGSAVAKYEQEYGALPIADGAASATSERGIDGVRGTTMADERTARSAEQRGDAEGGAPARAVDGLHKLRTDVGRLQKTLDDRRREMEAMERELRDRERDLAEREATEREIEAAANSITSGFAVVAAAFEPVKDLLAESDPILESELGDVRGDIDREIAAVHARIAKRAERRRELEDEVADLRGKLEEARRRLTGAEQRYEALKQPPSDSGELLAEIAALRQRLDQREPPHVRYAAIAELRRLASDFEADRPSAGEGRAALAAAWEAVRSARAAVRDVDERLTTRAADLQKVSAEVDDLRRNRLTRIFERVEAVAANHETAKP